MKLSWIMALIFAGISLILLLVNRGNKQKREKAESEKKKMEKELDKQKSITLEYIKREIEAGKVQQKATKDNAELQAVVKEAQTSEKPVKKNVDVANDIVSGFNSSVRL